VDLSAQKVGLSLPPCPVHLVVDPPAHDGVTSGAHWRFKARMYPGNAEEIARWLDQWLPLSNTLEPGVAPKSLEATFAELPAPWDWLLEDGCVGTLVVTPEGTLSLVVKHQPKQVQAYIEGLRTRLGPEQVRVRTHYGHDSISRVEVTKRQAEVISLAVALGYYEVPRRLDLRTLAKKLNLSLGATSELMRRGEATIIASYIDSMITKASAD
jgi:hypothetical protein